MGGGKVGNICTFDDRRACGFFTPGVSISGSVPPSSFGRTSQLFTPERELSDQTSEVSLMTDIIEDILAFIYAEQGTRMPSGNDICPVCGSRQDEGDDGELHCPEHLK